MVKQYWYLLKHSSFNCHYWCLAWGSLSSVYLDRSEVLMNCLGFTLNMYINIYSVLGWTCPMYNNTVNNKYPAAIYGEPCNQSLEAIFIAPIQFDLVIMHNVQPACVHILNGLYCMVPIVCVECWGFKCVWLLFILHIEKDLFCSGLHSMSSSLDQEFFLLWDVFRSVFVARL